MTCDAFLDNVGAAYKGAARPLLSQWLGIGSSQTSQDRLHTQNGKTVPPRAGPAGQSRKPAQSSLRSGQSQSVIRAQARGGGTDKACYFNQQTEMYIKTRAMATS